MPIDPGTVDHIAHLARLELSDADRRVFQEQLNGILDYIAVLDRLDLSDVPATSHVVPLVNALRDDAPAPPLPRDAVLAAAPEVEDGAFRVPRVLEDA